jgi:maltose O-acetyltransferase
MTEREKMLGGLPYNTRDAELISMYWKARETLHAFTRAMPSPDRMQTLRGLLGEVAPDVWIEPPFFCEYGPHIRIGARTYININCFFQDNAAIEIGSDTLIGPGVQVCCASHPVDADERVVAAPAPGGAPYVTSSAPVKIGKRVWIGGNVTILGGVTIGDDCVIGAGSVVTKNIPAGSIAYGVPCRVQEP